MSKERIQKLFEPNEDDDIHTIKIKNLRKKLAEFDTQNSYSADTTKITEHGIAYLKSQDLTEDELQVGKEEVARQTLDKIWNMEKQSSTSEKKEYQERDDEGLMLLGQPFSIDYDAIDEEIDKYRHFMAHGTDSHFSGELTGSLNKPIILSEEYFNNFFRIIIYDFGKVNQNNQPEQINGYLKIKNKGVGMRGGKEDTHEMQLELDIPELTFRCCKPPSYEEVVQKYSRDQRSLWFSIWSRKDWAVLGTFDFQYDCNARDKRDGRSVGVLGYKMTLLTADVSNIDYSKVETHGVYDPLKPSEDVQYGVELMDNWIMQFFHGDLQGSYPNQPTSLKGVINVTFKVSEKDKDAKDFKVNLGSPASPANPHEKLLRQSSHIELSQNTTKQELHDEL